MDTSGNNDPGKRKDKVVYCANRDHPLVARALQAPEDFRPVVEALLRLLEETVPVRQIWLDSAERAEMLLEEMPN